jgi:hypothetical protein
MSKNFIDMLECDEDRDYFYDAVSEEFTSLPPDEQDNLFRWICEEVSEVMDREDAEERTIVGELADKQKQTLREMGWEI